MEHNYTYTKLYKIIQNQPACFKITSESENELLNMNFQGKCAIKFVHGLPKLGPSRNVSSKVYGATSTCKNRGSMDPVHDKGVQGPGP